MRRIIESSLVSLDGVIGDPNTWAGVYFDDAAAASALEQLRSSEAMLMGRGSYEYLAVAFSSAPGAYAERLNTMPKYVFSSTLSTPVWDNTTVVRGDVVKAARDLKQPNGRDLIMYGHGRLGQTLLRHGLLDELRVAIHPTVVGRGKLFFQPDETATLELMGTQALPTGVAVLTYQPAR